MNQRIIFSISIALLSLFIAITPAQAHILATDGSIGAVLHIDPDDDPIAGEQAGFFFDIKDKTNKFSAASCNCRVDIYEGDKIIYSDAIVKDKNPSLNSASFFYTFPQRDVYQVKLIGAPSSPGFFQPFTISYDIRVERMTNASSQTSLASSGNWFTKYIIYFVALGVIILIFVAYAISKTVHKQPSEKSADKEKNEVY
jgi:hypothetical protein